MASNISSGCDTWHSPHRQQGLTRTHAARSSQRQTLTLGHLAAEEEDLPEVEGNHSKLLRFKTGCRWQGITTQEYKAEGTAEFKRACAPARPVCLRLPVWPS
jgi:hypothetical protein